jgi:low temperature requirement protein LtrA
MDEQPTDVQVQLRKDLRHRLRPMTGRDPQEQGRATTPVELLYDLTYVIAFATAAEQLAHHIGEGHTGAAIGAYLFAVFAVTWAWLNFTWFASAYGNDDALFRVATLVQMIGVVVLIFGIEPSFAAAAEGHSPNHVLMVVGYVVMRVPLIALWLRAAWQDHENRRVDVAYAGVIAVMQVGWVLTAIVPLPVVLTVAALVVVAVAELIAPVLIERRLGNPPWNAGHIAERFSLLTLITLGEVVAATTAAVAAMTSTEGWSVAAVAIVTSGLVLVATLWWAYFLIPSRTILERWPDRIFAWRYVHLPIFGAIAAVGAGLRVASTAVEEKNLSALRIALSLAVPVGILLILIFLTWSVLLRARDLTHVPLFLACLAPLVAAGALPLLVGATGPVDPTDADSLRTLVAVIALVALAGVVEVVGHELVGYRHTMRALEENPG